MVPPGFPPGFRFCPTEEELVRYLLMMVRGMLHINININFSDVYGEKPPWEICGGIQNFHCFTKLNRVSPKKVCRSAAGGEWHGNTSGADIVDSQTQQVIGSRKVFSFREKKGRDGVSSRKRTKNDVGDKWNMHEYSLAGASLIGLDDKYKDYVLCVISRSNHGRQRKKQKKESGFVADSDHTHEYEASLGSQDSGPSTAASVPSDAFVDSPPAANNTPWDLVPSDSVADSTETIIPGFYEQNQVENLEVGDDLGFLDLLLFQEQEPEPEPIALPCPESEPEPLDLHDSRLGYGQENEPEKELGFAADPQECEPSLGSQDSGPNTAASVPPDTFADSPPAAKNTASESCSFGDFTETNTDAFFPPIDFTDLYEQTQMENLEVGDQSPGFLDFLLCPDVPEPLHIHDWRLDSVECNAMMADYLSNLS
ncbi:hypothetical protein Tsubulata_002566 [Turnera subulata]|uniref:NAC domain-containing protein n=1 Tax=Turnera subulata TaxID=218843 RepID=A0A9Q0G9F1_9ROSI|nr:hypothetical protein Tsubulata_002566 [Turnera subulata]